MSAGHLVAPERKKTQFAECRHVFTVSVEKRTLQKRQTFASLSQFASLERTQCSRQGDSALAVPSALIRPALITMPFANRFSRGYPLNIPYIVFSLLLAISSMSACDVQPYGEKATKYQVVFSRLDIAPRLFWEVAIADFDDDGDDDLLLEGHDWRVRDRVFYYDGIGYQAGAFAFPNTSDRHDCDTADVDQDGDLDVYCSGGASRGLGRNVNPLFLGDGKSGSFTIAPYKHGAEDEFGRGRLVGFLDANGDVYPDLLVSVWGPRSDSHPNETTLYLNQKGVFESKKTALSGDWGGRCMVIFPSIQFGRDDVVLCHAQEGASYFQNTGTPRYQRLDMPFKKSWYLAITDFEFFDDSQTYIATLIAEHKQPKLRIYKQESLVKSEDEPHMSVELRAQSDQRVLECRPSTMAIGDATGDGYPDILIGRVEKESRNIACKGDGDLLLIGPSFEQQIAVQPVDSGQKAQVYFANGHFVRLSGGKDWTGGVELLHLQPMSESNK